MNSIIRLSSYTAQVLCTFLIVWAFPMEVIAATSLITVDAPERVAAGETVRIEVAPTDDVFSDVLVSLGDQQRLFPRFIVAEQDASTNDMSAAILSIELPEDRSETLYLWVQMRGAGLETRCQGDVAQIDWIPAGRGAAGGLGGGGVGGTGAKGTFTGIDSGTTGYPHTGGGGGGGGMDVGAPYKRHAGYAGGSGLVIVRYPQNDARSLAKGGRVQHLDGYTIHTFYEDDVFETNGKLEVEVLVVGGGGGGGAGSGGGGGGGGVLQTELAVHSTSTPVVVGAGGGPGENGEPSHFGSIQALGGGAGGSRNHPGASGGSGGGGAGGHVEDSDFSGGQGTAGQGYAGGTGRYHPTHAEAGGGGGGAGAVGLDGDTRMGSFGGDGIRSAISGTVTYYGGGGGGGRRVRVDQDWKWVLASEIPADAAVAQVDCLVPAHISGELKQAVISTDPDFKPNADTDPYLIWNTNRSSVGVHPLRITAQDPVTGVSQDLWIEVEVYDPDAAAKDDGVQAGEVHYVDLSASANVPMLPDDPALHIVDAELRAQSSLDILDFRFPLQSEGAAFMAIAQGETQTEEEDDAEVPQGEDLLRVIPSMLPSELSVPVNISGEYIGFLHGVRGSAKLLDELFAYEIEYEDGEKILIPVREGERVAGHLMDYFIKDGVLVYSSLIDGASVNVFFTQWKNPRPDKTIVQINMSASSRMIAFLLGLALYEQDISEGISEASGGKAYVTANFAVHPREFKGGLFSMNAPEFGSSEEYFKLLADMKFPNIRMWNSMKPTREDYLRGFDVERDLKDEELRRNRPDFIRVLENFEEKYAGHKEQSVTPIFYTLIRKPYLWKDDGSLSGESTTDHPEIFDAVVDWYMDLLRHVYEHHGLPITHVALYNEIGIGRTQAVRMKQYQFYNALARRVKAAYPELLVGGMSECWPCHNVIGEFLEECGEVTEFISWQMYPTGDAATPFAELMDRTDRYAMFTRRIQDVNRAVMPDRILPQVISEYSMNYSAWRPSDLRLRDGHAAVWTWSVLRNLLYDGEAEMAHSWHFTGRTYGSVQYDSVGVERIRPSGELFRLINNRLPQGTRLSAVNSDLPNQVEGFAAVTPEEYVFALTNRSDREIPVEVELLNFDPIGDPSPFFRGMEIWTIQAEETTFTTHLQPMPGQTHTVVMPPFSIRFVFFDK
ncbi:hypothetical protein QEH59_09435 [Coraliomargarita sp. SDUM461004]|uniref:Glycine-rich domain-containing protein n=1 Tax=Thalassobacterium sedimentorum TaxID=3041258 RepID=A0ABU1AM20_9BACT|nr:hypothetical protein [Coraliomargarita sp. SDUM461004]MDQ8194648.1 hypothetical protein [Coraliomargarita sp. SDUM461004]